MQTIKIITHRKDNKELETLISIVGLILCAVGIIASTIYYIVEL